MQQAMKKQKSNSIDNKGRRTVLKGIASSGGIAGAATVTSWSKPMVESVLLPAHATTSAVLPNEGGLRTFTFAGTLHSNLGDLFRSKSTLLSDSDKVESRSVLERIIPNAQAQAPGSSLGDTFEAILVETATDVFTFQLLATNSTYDENCITYSMLSRTGLMDGVEGQVDYDTCFGFTAPIFPATVNIISTTSATVTIEQTIIGPMPIVSNANPLTLPPCPCIEFEL